MAARGRKKGTVSGTKQYNLLMIDGTVFKSIYAKNAKEAYETLCTVLPFGFRMNLGSFRKEIKQGGLPFQKNKTILAPGVSEEEAKRIASAFQPEFIETGKSSTQRRKFNAFPPIVSM